MYGRPTTAENSVKDIFKVLAREKEFESLVEVSV
jgi:hypothetical protein